MRGRCLGLALTSLALALPATASAAPKPAKVAEDYKVLVVTSASDPVSAAGVAAIQAAGTSGGFTVTAPSRRRSVSSSRRPIWSSTGRSCSSGRASPAR